MKQCGENLKLKANGTQPDTVGQSRDVWYSDVHNQKNGEMSTESAP